MATWQSVSRKLRGALIAGAIFATIAVGVSAIPFLVSCGDTAKAESESWEVRREKLQATMEKERAERREQREDRRQKREERLAAEEEKRRLARGQAELEAVLGGTSPKKHVRRVRRFRWESPAETRGKMWNIPAEENMDSLVTALLRVCMAEADGRPQDCVGIWQVVKNNRRRTCDRASVRRITECEENGGETYLSALRRHQRHVLGYIKARNRRAAWIANLTPDCEMPEGYRTYLRRRKGRISEERALNYWDAQYGSKTCPQAVADVRQIIANELPSRPGHRTKWLPRRPITWGGRCEEKIGACDDRMACERVLARIPNTDTLNAFWCRVSAPGCRPDPEPLCAALGYKYKKVPHRGRQVWRLAQPGEVPTPVVETESEEAITVKEAEEASNETAQARPRRAPGESS